MVKNLKRLRQENGISQQQLADIIMVSQQSINKYENHRVEPDIDTLIKMADYFNVTVDFLIGRTETPPQETTDKEQCLIREYRSPNATQKDIILNLIKSYK